MTTLIKGKELKKNYIMGKREVKALRGVNLDVQQGEFLVIAGPSGSGKTTLLNLFGLIDMPDSGNLIFEEQDLSKAKEKNLTKIRKQKIGFIFQNFNLVPVLSAYENIEFPLLILNYPAKQRKKLVKKYLDKVGLWDRKKHKPSQLSGGEQQRVAIARALVKQPHIVIADEPTANLDSDTTHQIIETMKKLNEEENITFIIASHDPIVINSGEKVVKIRDGKLDPKGDSNDI